MSLGVVAAAVVAVLACCSVPVWTLLNRSDGPAIGGASASVPAAGPGVTEAPGSVLPANSKLLAIGTINGQLRESSGTAKLVGLSDGRVQVYLDNLSTSEGQNLRVWLTDQPLIEGKGEYGWHVFDDGRYVDVGMLKSNLGNQVYDVPAGTNLDGLISLSIWCKGLAVSFAASQLVLQTKLPRVPGP